jgi:dihydroxyacetone synthase
LEKVVKGDNFERPTRWWPYEAIIPYRIATMAPSAVTPASSEAPDHLPVKVSKKANGQNGTIDDLQLRDAETTSLVLRTFRCLIADLCEQFKGGHPGSAMGMAAIGVALWKYVMRYSPENPNFFNRDRFVLSNGKGFLILSNSSWTMF